MQDNLSRLFPKQTVPVTSRQRDGKLTSDTLQ